MPVNFSELPRDSNGVIIGEWRVLHKSPVFEGGVGGSAPLNFVKGRGDRPVSGLPLHQLGCAMGKALRYEPWSGDAPQVKQAPRRAPQGVPKATPESFQTPQEREALKHDRDKAAAEKAVADAERRAEFAGRVPTVSAEDRAEVERLRGPANLQPGEKLPQRFVSVPVSAQRKPVADSPKPSEAASESQPEAPVAKSNPTVEGLIEDAGDDVGELRDLAAEVGVRPVDKRWRQDRLRAEIRTAVKDGADTSPPPADYDEDAPDDVDGVEDLDVLTATAAGLGIDTEAITGKHALREAIRRKRAEG